jgi:hypothetical protein
MSEKIDSERMSKALTPPNRKIKGEIDPDSQTSFDESLNDHFPSYFGNFGIFNPFLMLRMQARLTKRRFRQGHSFPFITVFMAIV